MYGDSAAGIFTPAGAKGAGRHADGLTDTWTRKSFVADGRTRARLFTSANSDADAEVTPEQTAGLSLCPLLVYGLPLAGHLGVRDTCCSCVKTRDFLLSDIEAKVNLR